MSSGLKPRALRGDTLFNFSKSHRFSLLLYTVEDLETDLFYIKTHWYKFKLLLLLWGITVWDGANKILFKISNLSNYQPWRNIVRGKRTCTFDMCVAQDVQQQSNSAPIDRKDIAQALHSRNFLRSAESIQISPNERFCSIKFTTTHIMQTFCTEGLTISKY